MVAPAAPPMKTATNASTRTATDGSAESGPGGVGDPSVLTSAMVAGS